jgi:[acyl-carrier-protein] S-malonyltransferase
MGAEIFESRPDLLGDRSDEILGWSLRQMCLEGPEERLTRTEHAQPALFAVAYALWEELAGALPGPPDGAAGHSLGEYTALAASGAFDYDTTLRVVAARGRAMSAAADEEPSGMAALIGVDEEQAEVIAAKRRAEEGRLEVANINAPGQIVVAGGEADMEWLASARHDLGVRRVIPLNVAGAFHSSFMKPASTEVAEALDRIEVSEPSFPVWSNTTAQPHSREEITEVLARQVVSTVRFRESLEDMARRGIRTFVHVGPGDVTAGMAKRTVRDAEVLVVSEIGGIPTAIDALGTMT